MSRRSRLAAVVPWATATTVIADGIGPGARMTAGEPGTRLVAGRNEPGSGIAQVSASAALDQGG